MEELSFFLELQIKQSLNGTSICQEKYIKEVYQRVFEKNSKLRMQNQ